MSLQELTMIEEDHRRATDREPTYDTSMHVIGYGFAGAIGAMIGVAVGIAVAIAI